MDMKEVEELLADYVEVTLRLPKQVVEWFKDQTENVEKRLTQEVVELAYAQIEGTGPEALMAKYGLKPVLKEYGLINK